MQLNFMSDFFRFKTIATALTLAAGLFLSVPHLVLAQPAGGTTHTLNEISGGETPDEAVNDDHTSQVGVAATGGEGGGKTGSEAAAPVFESEHGTWFNWLTKPFTSKEHGHEGHPVVKFDYLPITLFVGLGLVAFFITAARKAKIRPQGKPASVPNLGEAAVDAYQDYLISVMGEPLARKYTPLIASFFFTILVMNWVGLIPGLISPTAIPAIPVALALIAFGCVHVIAIKETSFKAWFMHFVGEPKWLAFLNFPLHIVGELIKPLSLSLRLLCNVFGEEKVIATLAGFAATILPFWLPIPFQLPMIFLGTFFGFLQALVFSTLLAIYISILATDHSDHDAHNNHGHVEHDMVKGRPEIIAHATESPVA